jgi:hypothetical protein
MKIDAAAVLGHPKKRMLSRLVLLSFLLIAFPLAASAQCIQTRSFSEEDPPVFCPTGFAVKGVACYGRYCDSKRLTCCPYTSTFDGTVSNGWSTWFSEEGASQGRNRQSTNVGFVSGIACRGRYCDELRLNFMISAQGRNVGQCAWTDSFSEETSGGRSNVMQCPGDHFVSGIQCDGGWCDNLRLYCCRLAGTR